MLNTANTFMLNTDLSQPPNTPPVEKEGSELPLFSRAHVIHTPLRGV
jgi:hypothetical protein